MVEPATWRRLLGRGATHAEAQAASEAYQVLPPRLERDFLRKVVVRIDIREADATAAVTFTPLPPRLFAAARA